MVGVRKNSIANTPILSLGQIYSALAYYWDCKTTMDADLAQRAAQVAILRQPAPVTLLLSRIYVQRGQ